MARFLSNAKILSDRFSVPLFRFRRSYGAEAKREVSGKSYGKVRSRSGMVGEVEKRPLIKEDSSAWAPDPITGYYRPANRAADIDPAELRKMLLNHRVKPR